MARRDEIEVWGGLRREEAIGSLCFTTLGNL
jgi:hypothetical protein